MKRELLVEEYSARKNIMVIGDISVGKTRNVMFPLVDEIIEEKDSMLILDAKEEYINRYYEELKAKDYNVIIVNLKDLDKSEGWNPLSYPYSLYQKGDVDRAIDYIEKLGETIFFEGNTNEQFWALAAKDFFTGLVLGLFEDGKEEEINFNSIDRIFDVLDGGFRRGDADYVNTYFKMKNRESLACAYAVSMMTGPNETRGGVLFTIRQKLRSYIGRDKLNLLMNKTTFSYEEIGKKPTAIFVMARDYNRNLNSVATMFIEQLFEMLIDMKIEKKFNFILDNFEVIERFNNLGEMLGSGISRNVRFILGIRCLEDVLDRYGSYVRNLSDVVRVSLDCIEFEIGKRVEKVSNDFDGNVKISECNVVYPILESEKIKMFDLPEFVRKRIEEINLELANCGSTSYYDSNFDLKIISGSSKNEKMDSKSFKSLNCFSDLEFPTDLDKKWAEVKNNKNLNLSVEEMIEKIDKTIAELEAGE